MVNLFQNFPLTSKVLVYPGDKELDNSQKKIANDLLTDFFKEWNTHGKFLTAAFEIVYGRFIIVCVDDSYVFPSGCSVDSLVRKVKETGLGTGINFLSNGLVFYIYGQVVKSIDTADLKNSIAKGEITPKTKVFNQVENLENFKNNWLVEAENTWLKRYFKSENLIAGL